MHEEGRLSAITLLRVSDELRLDVAVLYAHLESDAAGEVRARAEAAERAELERLQKKYSKA